MICRECEERLALDGERVCGGCAVRLLEESVGEAYKCEHKGCNDLALPGARYCRGCFYDAKKCAIRGCDRPLEPDYIFCEEDNRNCDASYSDAYEYAASTAPPPPAPAKGEEVAEIPVGARVRLDVLLNSEGKEFPRGVEGKVIEQPLRRNECGTYYGRVKEDSGRERWCTVGTGWRLTVVSLPPPPPAEAAAPKGERGCEADGCKDPAAVGSRYCAKDPHGEGLCSVRGCSRPKAGANHAFCEEDGAAFYASPQNVTGKYLATEPAPAPSPVSAPPKAEPPAARGIPLGGSGEKKCETGCGRGVQNPNAGPDFIVGLSCKPCHEEWKPVGLAAGGPFFGSWARQKREARALTSARANSSPPAQDAAKEVTTGTGVTTGRFGYGSDSDGDFWAHGDGLVGKGNTEAEALADLGRQLEERGRAYAEAGRTPSPAPEGRRAGEGQEKGGQVPVVLNIGLEQPSEENLARFAGELNARIEKLIAYQNAAKPEPEKEAKTMSDTRPDLLTTLGEDLDSAATRLMRKQAVKALREPMAALLMRGLEDDDPALRAKVALFLSGEVGELVLCGMCSVLLGLVPNTPAWVDKLTRELRVHAAASGGDMIADLLLAPLRTVAADFLRGQDAASPLGLPAVERVAPPAVSVIEDEARVGAGKGGK